MKFYILYSLSVFMVAVNAVVYDSSSLEHKIMDGQEIRSETMKYVAGILEHKWVNGTYLHYYICGAFVISKKHIVTAHVCSKHIRETDPVTYEPFRVDVHVTKPENADQNTTPSFRKVYRIRALTEFPTVRIQSNLPIYTVGILLLQGEINYEVDINILSDQGVNAGKICYTFGWGLKNYVDEPEPVSGSNHLNILEIELDDEPYCKHHFYTGLFVSNHTMCGRPRQGCGKTMPGDYGGPLFHRGRIIGIAIAPQAGVNERSPSFFIKVHPLKKHIVRIFELLQNEWEMKVSKRGRSATV